MTLTKKTPSVTSWRVGALAMLLTCQVLIFEQRRIAKARTTSRLGNKSRLL